ncbi:alkaline phosphatase family protein [Cumulibacter soli]|uniref:alkaline phosphatase family protein n=1 Tax=Cumulibacter soli TaxID=2546344 RepID=UPI0010682F2D|nr:alkaline phosphatase family protein [Cumulibacter soli]
MSPLLPRYGDRSLAEVMPAVLSALGVPVREGKSAIVVPPSRAIAVLLVDGLGAQLLRENAADAPFLSSLRDIGPLTVGFPSSTSIGLTTLGTGRTPGTHGVVGIAMRADDGTMLDTLTWSRHGEKGHVDLREQLVPEAVQCEQTMWQYASEHGIETYAVAPRTFAGSGLTRAALRGTTYRGTLAIGDVVADVHAALHGTGRRLCYAYHADLDLMGHVHGPGSAPWRAQLRMVDLLAEQIATSLPTDAQLLITGDHGMVTIDDRLDADVLPELRAGVSALGGDPRSRHVYAEPGAAVDVLAAWRATLGERAWVLSRQEALAEGWFGPSTPAVRGRIGDVVVAMRGTSAVVRSRAEPLLAKLDGQHGSLTEAEQLVPLLHALPE